MRRVGPVYVAAVSDMSYSFTVIGRRAFLMSPDRKICAMPGAMKRGGRNTKVIYLGPSAVWTRYKANVARDGSAPRISVVVVSAA